MPANLPSPRYLPYTARPSHTMPSARRLRFPSQPMHGRRTWSVCIPFWEIDSGFDMALFTLWTPDAPQRDATTKPEAHSEPPPAPPPRPEGFVHSHISRCPRCEIAVHTVGTPPPAVCPYCSRALDQTEATRPMAEAYQPPSREEVAQRIHSLYHRPHMFIVAALAGIALFILGWAVVEQMRSFADFWYKGILIAVYSVIAGLFVITRFLFAAFYHPPYDDPEYNPSVTVLVPCYNEGEAIRQTIERIFSTGYPEKQLEVICVNDGSKDDSWKHILEAQTRHPQLVAVNFEHNRGLCHGWGVAISLARGEFMVCVDSDTFVFPNSLHKLMQGFKDPTVGGISGQCDIENADVNTLTRLQDVRYYFSYKIMKAAESVFGVVSCLPGCFSAYRRSCVLEVADKWINATVWGEHGNFADDRSLTNQILRNYKIIYDDTALATTICPEKWKQYIRQQARWERSYLREIWKTGKFIWRKHPVPALSWYAMMWMPLIEPFVMLQALLFIPVQAFLKAPEDYHYHFRSQVDPHAGQFLAAVPDKLDYSIFRAIFTPLTALTLALVIATIWAFRREAEGTLRRRWAPAALGGVCVTVFLGQFVADIRAGTLFAALSTDGFFPALAMSATYLGLTVAFLAFAGYLMGALDHAHKRIGWGLTGTFCLYFLHQIASVMPPNLEPENVSMHVYALTKAMTIPRTFLIGVMSITAVWSLHFLFTTGRRWWRAGFAFTLSYIVFFSWQIYWALATLNGKGWGTRGPAQAAAKPGAVPSSTFQAPHIPKA